MTEPLSEERLAEIRQKFLNAEMQHGRSPMLDDFRALLAEVDRLSGENRVLQDRIEAVEKLADAQGEDSYVMVYALRRVLSSGGE